MITLEREAAGVLFEQWWEDLREEWFKVEVLQDYSGEDDGPSLQAWLSEDKQTSLRLLHESAASSEWAEDLRESPARKIRMRIAEFPCSPYLEWEMEVYKAINIPLGGEDVRVIDKKNVADLPLPDGDFMIFDQTRVVRNHYDGSGRMLRADFYEDDDISEFLALRQALLTLSK